MDANELAFWYWLADVKGIGTIMSKKLLDKFTSPLEVYRSTREEIIYRTGIRTTLAENIEAAKENIDRYMKLAKNQVDMADRLGGRILTGNDSYYRDIYWQYEDEGALPMVIHILGNLECLDAQRFAIVGTRRPSAEGKWRARNLAHNLAKESTTVISGLAAGIDEEAHRGALGAGGRTIAILGCGADIRYPPSNSKLYEEIMKKGLILSEFPFGIRPSSENLRKRNRTIASFSWGVIIAECPLRSGTMIAARFTIQQRKPLFSFRYGGAVDNSGGEWLIDRNLAAELEEQTYSGVMQAVSQYVSAPDINIDRIFQELWPKRKKAREDVKKTGRAKKRKADAVKAKAAKASDEITGGIQQELPLKEGTAAVPAEGISGEFNLRVGDRVMHPSFGQGEIVKIVEAKNDFQITIKFARGKAQTFLWKYARLTRV